MRIAALVLALPLAAVAQGTQLGSRPTPRDRGVAESSQRGSKGVTAGGDLRTAAPGAGIETGVANGMAGGRTDEGPFGGTGIRETDPLRGARERAKADDQLRGPNAPGSFLRPADSPPDLDLHARPLGSGAEEGGFITSGVNYRDGAFAAKSDNEGGASPRGPAGPSERTQPPDHSGTEAPHPAELHSGTSR